MKLTLGAKCHYFSSANPFGLHVPSHEHKPWAWPERLEREAFEWSALF